MREPVITSRGSRSRRTISTLTWSGLTVVAALLWYARLNGIIRDVTTEPVALLLSAYAAFSSIFAWMLFSPDRRSAEQSPALFLAGGIAVLPPCVIAFCLMPPDSALRGWLTIGVFLLTVTAVISPVPDELFAVPRDRSTYLQPLTDSLFSRIRVSDQSVGFEHLQGIAPAVQATVLPYTGPPAEWKGTARDPWQDPFQGTGIRPVQPGRGRSAGGARRPVPVLDQEGPSSEPSSDNDPGRGGVRAPETEVRHVPRAAGHRRPVAPAAPSGQRPAAAFGFRTPASRDTRLREPDGSPATVVPVDTEASVRSSMRPELMRQSSSTVSPDVEELAQNVPEHSLSSDVAAAAGDLQFERLRDEFGGEMIEGTVKVRFEPGQRRANLHVPFTPPLPGIPDVECESVGNEALRIKVPVRQTYGIRIEARRSDTTAAIETDIGFSAVYSPPRQRA